MSLEGRMIHWYWIQQLMCRIPRKNAANGGFIAPYDWQPARNPLHYVQAVAVSELGPFFH